MRRFPLVLGALFGLLVLPAWGEEKSFLPQKDKDQTMTLTSDRLEYDPEKGDAIARGNVTLTQGTMELRADQLRFHNPTKQFHGTGNVSLRQGGNTLSATGIEYNLSTDQGMLWDGRFFIEAERYTLTGKQITRLGADRYFLQGASFTACDCPDDHPWEVRADTLDLTLDRYMVAKNLVFYAAEWPILALPYVIYPANTTRQTGLLVPDMGYSKKNGLRYSQEFFWAPTYNQDATFSFDFRDDKGSGGGIEYRYAFPQTRGTLQTYAFHDLELQMDRTRLDYQHRQRFSDRLALNINLQMISPEGSLSDLGDTLADRTQQVIESAASLTYQGNASLGYLLFRDTQAILHPENRFRQKPEIGGRLIERPIGPFYYDGQIAYASYEHDLEGAWERAYLAQKLSLPLKIVTGLTLTPWAGMRPIGYSRTKRINEPVYRNITAKGVRLHLDTFGYIGQTPLHLTKEVFYEEIETEDRSDLLEADESDRLHNRRSVTAVFSPQVSTLFSLRLSETYGLSSTSSVGSYSDLRGEAALRPASWLSLEAEGFYNWDHQNITAIDADIGIHAKDRVKIAVGRYFTRGAALPVLGDPFNPFYLGDSVSTPRHNMIHGQGWIRIGSFRLAGQVFYDEDADQPRETHYGLLYLKQCVAATLTYQRLPERDEIFFAVHLKGLGPLIPKRFAYLFD